MPIETFDRISAVSVVMRDNNRDRINLLLEKDRNIRDLESQLDILSRSEGRARLNEGIALDSLSQCMQHGVKMRAKLKRKNTKIIILLIPAAYGVTEALRPILPNLPIWKP